MDIDVLEQTPISLPMLKATLEELKSKQKDKELNFRAAKVLDYLTEFTTLDKEKTQDMRKKLIELNIPRLKEKHVEKLLDLMPDTIEDIKSLLVGENITIKAEDLTKILSVIKG